MNKHTLHLVLKGRYFDEILAGTKNVEYRDNTEYWRKRILKWWDLFGAPFLRLVVFHRGYTNQTITLEVSCIKINASSIELYLKNKKEGLKSDKPDA